MNRVLRTLLVLAAMVATAPVVVHANSDPSTAYRAGTISVPSIDEGANSASTVGVNQGRASHRVDIVTPPGREGVEPNLALVYSGGRDEGVVGAGWSLSIPSVTVRTSGRGGQPRWGTTVRYLGTSGEELVELPSTLADQDGDLVREALFREERDTSYLRYVQLSGGGWRVDYPDGRKLTLGTSGATQVARAGYAAHIARWLPESLVDPNGNELTYVWSDGAAVAADIGSVSYNLVARYLTEMRWACQGCSSASTYQRLVLGYEDRANHVTDFSAGYLVETEFQVTTIDTATVIGGVPDPIRSYALGYDLGETRVLLESVAVTGADGSAMPPMTIRYTDRDAPATAGPLATAPGLSFQSGVQAIDIDLDGRIDVADLSNVAAGGTYHRNVGSADVSFGGGTAITDLPGASLSAGGNVSAEDATRDVAMDVFDLDTGTLYPHDGATGWGAGAAANLPPGLTSADSVRIDINLDGYVDLVDTSVSPWFVYLDDGSRTYTDDSFALSTETTPTFGAPLHASSDGVLFGDLNGDGLVDVLLLDGAGTAAYFFPGRGVMGFGWLPEDGRALQHTTLTIASATAGPSLPDTALMDIDGDGFGDLVSFDGSSSRLRVFLRSPGAGFDDAGTGGPFTQSITANDGCRTADWDQDGVPEVLCSDGWQLYDFADQLPFLLEEVDNGLGQVTRLAYTTSARVAAAHESAGQPWATNVAMAMPVVQSTETDDSRGNVLVNTYDYRDAVYEADELEDRFEFVGFGYVETVGTPYLETTPGDPLSRVEYPQDPGDRVRRFFSVGATDYFLRGLLDCEETWERAAIPADFTCDVAASGPLLRVVSTHGSFTSGTGITTIRTDAEDRYVLEGGPVADGAWLRTEYIWDAAGNEVWRIEHGVNGTGPNELGDERLTATDYILDVPSWNLRLPKRVRQGVPSAVVGGPPTVLRKQFFLYDGATSWNVSAVGAGLLTETRAWTHNPITGATAIETLQSATHTSHGLPATLVDAAGTETTIDYDADFELFAVRRTVDPAGLGFVVESEVDPRHGTQTRSVDPAGAATTAGYDSLGRMLWLAQPGDSEVSPSMHRTYYDDAPTSSYVQVTKDDSADGLIERFTLDGAGRLLCHAREAGAGVFDIVEQREYSARGSAVLTALPYRGRRGCLAAQRVGGAFETSGWTLRRAHDRAEVDALGRPITLTHSADLTFRSKVYAPLTTTSYDEEDTRAGFPHLDTATTIVRDGLGNVLEVTESHFGAADDDPGTHSFDYAHSPFGELESVTDSMGNTIYTASYDSRGRLVRSEDADRGIVDTVFDAAGRAQSITDSRGETRTFAWDAVGRIASSASSAGLTSYHYDTPLDPARTDCHAAGRLGWVADLTGLTDFCYDERGRVVEQQVRFDDLGVDHLVSQSFDSLGRVLSRTLPDGTGLDFTYGDDGRPATITANGIGARQAIVTAVDWNAAGSPTRIALGNGATVDLGYDGRLRPATSLLEVNGAVEQDLALALDAVGNVESVTDAVGLTSAEFAYDDLYRMTSATGDRFGGETHSYRYDRLGNMTDKTSSDPTSPAHAGTLTYGDPVRVHALTDAAGTTFSYDAAGNLASDGTFDFQWTPRSMLASVLDTSTGATVLEHGYDYLQRRAATWRASGDSVHRLVDFDVELWTPSAGPESWHKYVRVGGRLVARFDDSFDATTALDQVVFFGTDHLGSPTLVMDPGGAIVERWATHPHGEENPTPLDDAGVGADYRDPSDTSSWLSHRFQGRDIDFETGQYDFGARVYRPDLGRFLSPDSIVPNILNSQSWNRYAFVRNNPLRFTDPTGHTEAAETADAADGDAARPLFRSKRTPGGNRVAIATDGTVTVDNELFAHDASTGQASMENTAGRLYLPVDVPPSLRGAAEVAEGIAQLGGSAFDIYLLGKASQWVGGGAARARIAASGIGKTMAPIGSAAQHLGAVATDAFWASSTAASSEATLGASIAAAPGAALTTAGVVGAVYAAPVALVMADTRRLAAVNADVQQRMDYQVAETGSTYGWDQLPDDYMQ